MVRAIFDQHIGKPSGYGSKSITGFFEIPRLK
jgi:hypothetical protein